MKLNKEQAKHLAGTMRIMAVGEFGAFGYHALQDWSSGWPTLLWSIAILVLLEVMAVAILRGQ